MDLQETTQASNYVHLKFEVNKSEERLHNI
jgi:hypothetical protein